MKNIIRLTVIAATLLALAMPTFAATPLYKPVKLPKIQITVPHYDFSYAIEQYLKEHPIT